MNFSIFELAMLVCFGFSWPFAIAQTDKSYLFMILILIGYVAGRLYCRHKIHPAERTNLEMT